MFSSDKCKKYVLILYDVERCEAPDLSTILSSQQKVLPITDVSGSYRSFPS